MDKRFTRFLLPFLFFAVSLHPKAKAQVNITTPDTAICPGTSVTLNATIGSSAGTVLTFTDDIFSPVIAIGFPFTFYGNTYSSCVISSNGIISFNTSNANGTSGWNISTGIPGNANMLNAAGLYTDINPVWGGSIEYSTQGTAPNRRFIATYCSIPHYNCTSLLYSFQIVLLETTNEIEMHISNKPSCSNGNGLYAIEGVQNAGGTQAVTVSGRNYPTNWAASNSSHKFTPSGTTYTVSSIPFQFYPSGLTNISWYANGSTTTIGTGNSITVTPTVSSYYVAKANGCIGTSSDTVNVSVLPATPAPGVSSPVNYCVGATTTPLTATGTSLKWYASATGGTGSTTAPTPSTSSAGTTTWYVSQMIGNCEGPRTAIVVNVFANPAAPTVTSNSPVCEGGTISLSTTATGLPYSWTGPNGFISNIQNPSVVNVLPVNGGTYTLSVTNTNNCSASTSVAVVVNPLPVITSTSFTNPTSCGGNDGTIIFNGLVSGQTYILNYSKNGTAQAAITLTAASGAIILSNLAAGTYNAFTITVNGCSTAVAGSIILTDPVPPVTPVVSSNSPVCVGNTLNLNANSATGATYTWTGPNGFSSTLQNPSISNTTIAAAGTYSVTATLNNCTSSAGSVTVVINPIPANPMASSNSPVCEGSTLSLNASTVAGATYSWVGPNGFSSNVQNPTISAVTANATGNYTVTATVNGCTSSGASTSVLINPAPVIGNITFTNPSVCNGTNGSVTLSGLISGSSYIINYSKNNTPQTAITAIANATGAINITGLTAGVYSNLAVTLNGCTSPIAGPVTLTDPSAPATPIVTNNGPLCSGSILNLTANSTPGVTYTWTGPNAFSSSLQNPSINNASTVNSGTYTVTATLNGCTSVPSSTTVVINPVPVISSTLFSDPTTCGGTNGTITLNGLQPGTTYTVAYSFNGNPATATIASTATGSIVIAGLGAGIYSAISVSLNGCTSATAGPITLSNPPVPATPALTANTPLCSGNTLSLTASAVAGAAYSWTGPGGFSSSLQNPSIPNAQPANSGNYVVTVSVNNCTSLPGNVAVVVNPTPNITNLTSSNPTGCNSTNGSITLSGLTSGAIYSVIYTRNGTPQAPTNIVANASGAVVITGLNAATYSNIQVSLNGCFSNIVGPVTLLDPATPSQPTISNNGPLCAGATLNLTANAVAGAVYNWSGPAGFTASSQNPVINNVQVTNAGTYTLTITLNNCTSVPSSTNVVINPIPSTPVVSSNSPVCDGNNLTLNATSSGVTFSWTGPNGFTSAIANPVINNATPLASGTYTVTASANGCVSQAASINAVVHPIPSAPGTNNVTYCQFTAATPLVATGQNLRWYTQPTGGSGSTIAPVPNTNNTGVFVWYVSQLQNGCESPRTPITVTVIPSPASPTVITPVTYCQGETATPLTATGQNLLWYTQPTGGTGTSTIPTPSTGTAGTFTWYVTQTVNGCESNRSSIVVTVYATPPAPLVDSVVNYCEGDNAMPLMAQGQNLTWYTQSVGGTSSSLAPTPNTSVVGITDYYVSDNNNGCESPRAHIRVIVSEKVFANITLSNEVICQYDTIVINNNTSNPASAIYNWNFDGGIILTGSGGGPYQIKWNSDGSKTVTVNVSNGACSATDSKTLTNKPSPHADFVLQPDACIGEIVNVQAAWNSLSGSIFNWNFGDAKVLSGTGRGLYKLKWDNAGSKHIMLQIENDGCRSELVTDTIKVHEMPLAAISNINSSDICAGDIILFTAQTDAGKQYLYNWSPSEFFFINGLPEASGIIKKSGYIHLLVSDFYGCSGKDSVIVNAKPCCDIVLPDAFTPNNDGRNDVFRIITQGNHRLSVFRIANRWGQIVFETGDIRQGWDGFYGGVAQDMGTYFYFIRYACGTGEVMEKKGELLLLK